MFSYRHAFHAGNHADVLKHTTLIAVLRHLVQKDTALAAFDTHAGAGLYRLDGDYALTSGEAANGFLRLATTKANSGEAGAGMSSSDTPQSSTTAPAIQDYLDLVATFNTKGSSKVYPGSPFIIQRFLRPRDRLKLFELHPTDSKTLSANVGQLEAGRQVAVLREDGFEGLKKFLPPPQKRAFVLCDPSFELKPDYQHVTAVIGDALTRFPTGTYMVWYPIIPRPEAHDLPRKLKALSLKFSRSWLHATLTVKSSRVVTDAAGQVHRPGLPASGVFLINPPHVLMRSLGVALPEMVRKLAENRAGHFTLEGG